MGAVDAGASDVATAEVGGLEVGEVDVGPSEVGAADVAAADVDAGPMLVGAVEPGSDPAAVAGGSVDASGAWTSPSSVMGAAPAGAAAVEVVDPAATTPGSESSRLATPKTPAETTSNATAARPALTAAARRRLALNIGPRNSPRAADDSACNGTSERMRLAMASSSGSDTVALL
ncbi:MAG: hypothetical protein R2770_05085 [Acidimicrobiales bacterium]